MNEINRKRQNIPKLKQALQVLLDKLPNKTKHQSVLSFWKRLGLRKANWRIFRTTTDLRGSKKRPFTVFPNISLSYALTTTVIYVTTA